ncbi:anti-sigma factor [Hamadaea tsunoensis]|uniref:anti-sigma factor n=1 Tax=Hamadaea tsunoensis TaxID=53368 RepID=UPI000402A104|nr:anti-sigma factor [Hamadaea tsunoensis]
MSHELTAAYALDAVDDTERREMEAHLATCTDCVTEIAEMRETLGLWAAAEVEPVEPPAYLRQAVLARIAETSQSAEVFRTPLPRRRYAYAGAAAAAVVVLALVGVLIGQQVRLRDQRTRADDIAAVLAAPDAQLHTAPATGGGQVNVVVSPSLSRAVVTLRDLPSAPGKSYQMWLVRDGEAGSAGVLEGTSADGVQLIDHVIEATDFGLTKEPAGGSAAPTPPMLVDIKL